MGNKSIGGVSPDLPPPNFEKDHERLYNTFDLLHQYNCKSLVDMQYELLNSKEQPLKNSEQIRHIKDMTSSCFLYYLDRSFYNCLHRQKYDTSSIEKAFVDYVDGSENTNEQSAIGKCLSDAEPIRKRINAILADPGKKKAALKHYEEIAKQSRLQINEYEPPYMIQNKVQLASEMICSEYYANRYMKSSDNTLHFAHYSAQFSRCMIAELCADKVIDCLSKDPNNDVLKCFATNEVKSCYQRFRRRGDLEQMFPIKQ
jgi:hypothetical protein